MSSSAEIQTETKTWFSKVRTEFGFIKGNFLIMVLSWLVMDLASEMPSTYYGLYVTALGGSATIIGLIASVSMIARAIVQIPGGYLADKYGRRWLISSMTFILALSYMFYVFAPDWRWIMVGAIINNLCNIYGPALNAIIADSLPPENRGMGFSIINLIASVSTTPSPLIAGWLYTQFGLVPSVRISYAAVVIAFLTAATIRLKLKETIENPQKIDPKDLLGSIPQSIIESVKVWGQVPRSAFALFINRVIMMFSISIFQPIMILWVIDDIGIPEVSWALILTALSISMIILSIPCGKLIDKIGKKIPLLAAYVIWMMIVPLFIYGDFYRLLIAMIFVGLLQILLMASSSALMADLVPRENRGKVSGSSNFFTLIMGAVGSFLGGYLYDNVSHQLPWWLQYVFVIPSILIILFFIKEPESETKKSSK